MADRCRAEYSQLNQIANTFNQQSDAIKQMNNSIKTCVEDLRQGAWIGKGADKFYAEYDSSVAPTLQRLERALSQAGSTTKKIAEVWKTAEQNASSCFHV
jgi:WXG100 family type VII secretion target